MTLEEIIIKAIPGESCPMKNAKAMQRRELAIKRLKEYIADKLSTQFNARPAEDKISNGLGENSNRPIYVLQVRGGNSE